MYEIEELDPRIRIMTMKKERSRDTPYGASCFIH